MPLPLKSIDGCLIEKYKVDLKHHDCGGYCTGCELSGKNKAIDQIGEVRIGLNRDKLAEIICDSRYGVGKFKRWIQITSSYTEKLIEISYEDADAIIAKEHEIIQVIKES